MPVGAPITYCCSVTPFDEQGELDEDALVFLMNRLATAGVGAYLGTASPGEGHTLSDDETERLYGISLQTVAGRVPVRAMGAEPRTAKEFARYVRIAESVGLDAAQLYSLDMGHGNRPTDAEQERYFRTLLDSMSIAATVSAHSAGGYVISLGVIDRLLSDYPSIVGLNVSSPDIAYVTRVIDVVDGRADVHVGGSLQALDVLALGGQGFLSADGILVPELGPALIDAYLAGDLKAAFDAYSKLMRMYSIFDIPSMVPGFNRWVKAGMRVLGLPGANFRPPYLPLSEETHRRIADAFRRLALPGVDVVM
jgi:4-hydroxy-tetrahydrodipicolinate synthase